MTSSSAEHRRLQASYRSRGRRVHRVSWSETHLAGSAVVVETDNSAYAFIPLYLGGEHLSVPGGAFRMACFTLDSTDEMPDVLISRPHDVVVGEMLWLSLAEDRRTTINRGPTLGGPEIDLTQQIPTSAVRDIYVVDADPGQPEF
ncbi:MAG TPA: hypothetical protein VMW08_15310 [Acidimicrobiales bacterium]|nr:hypothetical protein [Acidimicrobiales bacterium]